MFRLVSDANFNGRVVRALLRRRPDLDLVRVEDVGLKAASDPDILVWAATAGRIVLTHDRDTMAGFAYDRVAAGLPMPGVFIVDDRPTCIGEMMDDVLLVIDGSEHHEWADSVQFLPL